MTVKRLGKILLGMALVLSSVATSAGTISHVVKKGDTLWVLAKKHHTTAKQIAKANGIDENATLPLGKKLQIPTKEPSPKIINRTRRTESIHHKAADQVRAGKLEADKAVADKVAPTSGNSTLITKAVSCCGIRYKRGGTSRSGFDCSGFTRYIFIQYGIALPHSSAAQANMGKPVSRGELRPGDLVFFQTYRRGISHVGIYTGNNRFVHAANSGRGVTTDSLNSSYYSSRFRCARRVK